MLGALPLLLIQLAGYCSFLAADLRSVCTYCGPAVYMFLVTSTTYYRLSGIRIR